MGNSNSSYMNSIYEKLSYYDIAYAELIEKYDQLQQDYHTIQNENTNLKANVFNLKQLNNNLINDVKNEKILRINLEKNIKNTLSSSLCDIYMEAHNNVVLDDTFEKKQLKAFLTFIRLKINELFKTLYPIDTE